MNLKNSILRFIASSYKRLFHRVKKKKSFFLIAQMLSKPIVRTRRTSLLYDEVNTELTAIASINDKSERDHRLYMLGSRALVTGATALNDIVARLRHRKCMDWLQPFLQGVFDAKGDMLSVSVLYEIFDECLSPLTYEYPEIHHHSMAFARKIHQRIDAEPSKSGAKIRKRIETFLKANSI